MKKIQTLLVSISIFLLQFAQVSGQDAISQKVNQHISAIQQTTMYTPLEAIVDAPEELPNIPETLLAEKQLFRLSNPTTGAIQERSSEYLQMTIPIEGQNTELQLIEADIFTDDFRAVFASAPDVELDIDMGRHYWGIVKDAEGSLVTISFFDNEIIGAIIMNDRQYTLGKAKDSEYHILYKDSDLNYTPDFSCEVPPPPTDYQYDTTSEEIVERSDCYIRIHIEADYSLFQTMGGTSQTSNYVNGMFAEVAALYANESFDIRLSYLNIWNVPSPYNADDGFLASLRAQNYGTTNGDFVHLTHTMGGGGSASLGTYCSNVNASESGVHGYYSSVPIYSWDVDVTAHELGHSFGSYHTHDCLWNGNNTAIDRCGQEIGYGSECGGIIPSDGGTILSYCYGLNVGINFSKGFDPQVINVMKNARNSAPCLEGCAGGGNGGGNNDCTNSGGLQANYYNNTNLSGNPISRIDPTVNFNWGLGSPDPQIGNDNYSARWEGSIEAPTSGNYTFYTNTDDGVRLWINNNLIIDKWVNQAPREWSGNINMTAGQKVNIKMEYFEGGGGALAQLLWSGPGVGKQIIPGDRLFNCAEVECNAENVTNVALGKNTSQSSNFAGFTSDKANNGNTNGTDFTHTQYETNAWWEIDLGATYNIQDIKIFNRTDCCSDRLSNFHVFVSDAPFSSKDLSATLNQSGVGNYYFNGAASVTEDFNINRTGRYIRVQLSGINILQLSEVQVFACTDVEFECNVENVTNVALDKNTSQSSNFAAFTSDKANNGNTNGTDFSHTQANTNAWWEIDLGAIYNIRDIKIFNRTDCCSDRLSNFHVFVSDAPFSSKDLSATLNQSGVGNYYFNGAASVTEDFNINRTGRYVRVQLSGTNNLQLSEVQIFACTDTNSSGCDFSLLPGEALDVGAGGGKTFVVGTNRRVYEWNGAGWNIQPAGPQANRIDVETSGIPWIVATDGRIYRLVNNQWQNIGGWASDVGCGANQVYVIGGGNRIYMWNGANGFTAISSGAAVRIDVAGDGNPWIVGTDGLVYQYIGNNWYPKGNFTAKDISIQEGGNRVCGLASSNGQVTSYEGNGTWEPKSGAAEHLSVDSNGNLWVVNVNRQIFTTSCSANPQLAPNPTIANLVYPNPTSNKLFLNLDPYYLDKNLDYTITNVQGQLVDRGAFSSIYSDIVEVDVSSSKFPAGTYFLSLTTNDTRQVIKFVVMK